MQKPDWDAAAGALPLEIGTVEGTGDKKNKGRVSVRLPSMAEGEDLLEGVEVMQPPGGAKDGCYWLPDKGARVVVGYTAAAQKPIVLGCLHSSDSALVQSCYQEDNTCKRLHFAGGMGLACDETKDKQTLTVETPGGLRITLSEHENEVRIAGKSGKNLLLINEKDNKASFCAKGSLTLTVGNSSLTLKDGEITLKSGKLSLSADTLALKGSQKTTVEGTAVTVSGTKTEVTGKAELKLKASGVASLNGGLVKIN